MVKILDQIKQKIAARPWIREKLPLSSLFSRFQEILELNNQILDTMADMGDKLGGNYVFDGQYIRSSCRQMTDLVQKLIYNFNILVSKKYTGLNDVLRGINSRIEAELAGRPVIPETDLVIPYEKLEGEFADVVGGKNANLAELKSQLGLSVPGGFAVTTAAFKRFLEHNRFIKKIQGIIDSWTEGSLSSRETAYMLQNLIQTGEMPPELTRAGRDLIVQFQKSTGKEVPFWAIRSSALGEDSEHSFAGQFKSILNVPRNDIADAYRQVLASAYSAEAMEYRRHKGISEHEVAMAVGCQEMIAAKKSGVLNTLDPSAPQKEKMILSAVWGLGAPAVSGKVQADRYVISRRPPHDILEFNVVRKSKQLIPKKRGGCEVEAVRPDLQTRTSLTDAEIAEIANTGMLIERYFHSPQEIEWAIDSDGRLFILQARPLNIRAQISQMVCDISSTLKTHSVVFAGKGIIAQNGIAAGRVYVVKDDRDLDRFPAGAILVAKYTSPKFAKVAGKANGIITDVGSSTGHMANIAREFRIPAIINTGIATRLLANGREITMDAEENVIYDGIVKDLCLYGFSEPAFEETYEYRLLRRVLKSISPLNLVDPTDKNFSPAACRTLHDITRFVHEKAVEALIDINYYQRYRSDSAGRKLKLDIPMDLVVLDIGEGITGNPQSPQVEKDQIVSRPMHAFLEGLSCAGAWDTEPVGVDFKGFMSSLTRTFSEEMATPKYIGRNLAVISKNYANISLRLGYHFNIIDMYMGENVNDNYLYFRFLGGVTEQNRRNRRFRLIAMILEQNDFMVERRQDLVIARIKKVDAGLLTDKIKVVGSLVAFTRQLDVKMNSDGQVEMFIEKFNQLHENKSQNQTAGTDQKKREQSHEQS